MLYHQNTLKENKLIMGFMHKDEYEDFIIHQNATVISAEEISEMKQNLSPLIGAQFNVLSIPKEILKAFGMDERTVREKIKSLSVQLSCLEEEHGKKSNHD